MSLNIKQKEAIARFIIKDSGNLMMDCDGIYEHMPPDNNHLLLLADADDFVEKMQEVVLRLIKDGLL